MVGGVKDGIAGAWDPVVSFFGDKTEELQAPIEETKTGILGIFQNLQTDLVGNSVIPETTDSIIVSFTTMNTTLKTGLTTFIRSALSLWRRFTSQMAQLWRNMVTIIVELARRMESILTSILQAIVALFDEWREAVEGVLDKLEKLPDAMAAIGEQQEIIENMIDAFEDWLVILDSVSDKINDIIERMERLSAMSLPSEVPRPSGPPPAQAGIWRVPGTSVWTLHRGETVLPPDTASLFRSFISSIRDAGIGNHNLALPGIGTPAVANNIAATSNQYMFGEGAFAGAFPNVTDGDDAGDFLQSLDELTTRGALRGTVVG